MKKDENKLLNSEINLVKEWDYNLNHPYLPKDYKKHSNTKVYWICEKGHSYQARIDSRVSGTGCPYCANRKVLKGYNDLSTTNPQLITEWNFERNTNIKPDQITYGSNKKVWWKCHSCGYEWEAKVFERAKGKGCPCCTGKKVVAGINDISTTHPYLEKDWDYVKNGELTPRNLTFGSNKKAWWKCHICGFEWKARINDRAKLDGTNCPNCSKHQGTSFPQQAIAYYLIKSNIEVKCREKIDGVELDVYIPEFSLGIEYDGYYWHKEVNFNKDTIMANKNIRIVHIFDGEEKTYIRNNVVFCKYERTYNYLNEMIHNLFYLLNSEYGLSLMDNIDIERDKNEIYSSYLYNKHNSVALSNPELMDEWDYNKNNKVKLEMFTRGSDEKFWWKCKKCGYEWRASISHRVNGTSCPVCSNKVVVEGVNDLTVTDTKLSKEWNYEKNKHKKPQQYCCGSGEIVWWKCPVCNYEWKKRIVDRHNGKGCPVCAGRKVLKGYNDLFTTNPELEKDWDFEKNKNLSPEKISKGKHLKVWWKCHTCGHEWEALIYNRSKGKGCPNCYINSRSKKV